MFLNFCILRAFEGQYLGEMMLKHEFFQGKQILRTTETVHGWLGNRVTVFHHVLLDGDWHRVCNDKYETALLSLTDRSQRTQKLEGDALHYFQQWSLVKAV